MQAWHRFGLGIMAASMVALVTIVAWDDTPALAREQYFKAFKAKYASVKEANQQKCSVCHIGKNKKMRNEYGKTLAEALGDGNTNVKDAVEIKKALETAEGKDSPEMDKTYGDLLKDGKLPIPKKVGGSDKSGGKPRGGKKPGKNDP